MLHGIATIDLEYNADAGMLAAYFDYLDELILGLAGSEGLLCSEFNG